MLIVYIKVSYEVFRYMKKSNKSDRINKCIRVLQYDYFVIINK